MMGRCLRNRELILKIISSLLTLYAVLCLAIFLIQDKLIFYPQARHIKHGENSLKLQASGADLVVTHLPRPSKKALIYFGGNAEDVSWNLSEFARTFPDHALYLLHYRGYGGSTGKPSEAALHQDAELLYQKVKASHDEIAVMGRSLGSGVAVRLASQYKLSQLILVTPYDSLATIASAAYPYLPVQFLLRHRFDSVNYAPKIETTTLIVMAEHDQVIPASSTRKLLQAFKPSKARLHIIAGANHQSIASDASYLSLVQAALANKVDVP